MRRIKEIVSPERLWNPLLFRTLQLVAVPALILLAAALAVAASHALPRSLSGLIGVGPYIVLLLGTDAFRNLSSWERWRDLFPLAHVFVAQRPGHSLTPGGMPAALAAEWRKRAGTPDVLRERPGGSVVTYGTTALDISASAIRAHFAQARSPRYLLPSAVLDYIEAHALYAHPGGAP